MTSLEQQNELQKKTASQLFGILTGRPWTSAVMFYSEVVRNSHMWGEAKDAEGKTFYFDYPDAIADSFRELREAMTDPEKGAWLSAVLKLTAEGRFTFEYNWDRRVYWNPELDDPLQVPDGERYPDDSRYVEEFELHPRSAAYLPDWVPSRPPADHDQDRIDAILAIPAPVPADLQPLAEQWGWSDLFEGAEEAFGRWLGTEPYRSLLDEISRQDSDRVADGLVQDVIGELMGTYVDPRPAKDVIRLWRALAQVRRLTEPDGLDQLDPEAPLERTSKVTAEIRGDIIEALAAVIDAKIETRFP
jgi:hypothetical protein